MTKNQNIVVLGAGFSGLKVAISIAKKIKKLSLSDNYEVILIDRHDYQTYTPTLYEIATTSKQTANYLNLKNIVTFPIQELIRNYRGIKFINSAVENLDLINGDVHCANGEKIKFNYLVLALGSETNYFGIPGLRENSLPLKTFIDALAIRNRILNAVSEGKKDLKIIIGGGGSTGVELAGEIQEWLCELKEEVRACEASLSIVEAAPTTLFGFDDKIIKKVQKRLINLGIKLLTGETIKEVNHKEILTEKQKINYDILIWTGGVKASNLMEKLPLKLEERKYQVRAFEGMECLPETPDLKLYGKIYGLGDAVCFYHPITGKPVPKVARAALIQADIVAHNILEDIKNTNNYKTYKPKDYPYVIPVGGKFAVAKLGKFIISGFWGWTLKGLVELNYLISVMGIFKAMKIFLKGLKIFIQNDRLG